MTPLEQFKIDLDGLAFRMHNGCGNHGCQIMDPKGMATNGPCICSPRHIARLLLEMAAEAEREGSRWKP